MVYMVFLGKPKGKIPQGRPRLRWVDNIRIVLWREVVYIYSLEKPDGKRPLGSPRRRWMDIIRMDL